MPRRIADEEAAELVARLQAALPESRRRSMASSSSSPAPAAKVLKETCRYIRSLHREVDDLGDRLARLMAAVDGDGPQADVIRSLLISSGPPSRSS